MGLGYRPFRLTWWIIGFILFFAAYYFMQMSTKINDYISKDERKAPVKRAKSNQSIHPIDNFINCLYFSSMVLITFRLRREVLATFRLRDRWIIVSEWLIGFLILVAFVTLSKSGSILQTLKNLFVG